MGDEAVNEVDPTRGLTPLVVELPIFEVEGKEYKMTRLGLTHAMMALRIFAAASGGIMKMSVVGNMQSNPAAIGLAILSALPYAENHVKDLIAASILKKTSRGYETVAKLDLEDANRFPLESLITIIEQLGSHPDLRAFLKNIGRLQQSPLWEELQNRARGEVSAQNNNSNAS